MKLLLADINGTITRSVDGSPFTPETDPEAIELIPGVASALLAYHRRDFVIMGVSNQGGIDAGKRTFGSVIAEMQHTMALARGLINSIYFCPDFAGRECWHVWSRSAQRIQPSELDGTFRKPDPGMLQLAIAFTKADFVLMVGDRDEDQKAAAAAKIAFLDAATWRSGDVGY